jgi:glucose/arabinose dehydrogenase
MQRRIILIAVYLIWAPIGSGQAPPKPLVTGLKNPTSVAVGGDGRIYVAVVGEWDKDGDGAVLVIDQDKAIPFAVGLDDPLSMAAYQQWLFVTDKKQIRQIDAKGNATTYMTTDSFPDSPHHFNGIAVDPESGTVYVTAGGTKSEICTVYRISPQKKVSIVYESRTGPHPIEPGALLLDGQSHLLISHSSGHGVFRMKLADGSYEKLTDDSGGLAWDRFGRLFIGCWPRNHIAAIPRPDIKAVMIGPTFKSLSGVAIDRTGKRIVATDLHAGTFTSVPISIPGHEVDETPMPLQTALAFPDLKWEGWKGTTDDGKVHELRTILLTHAGDGSNRVFVGEQHGVIYVFPDDPKAAEAKVFLDLRERVAYNDSMNEEGFLGLAFHPKFKENGKFFVYYTTSKAKLTNILSRFRVRKEDPNRADPDSEEELMRFEKPFWNHDGGTVCFGPDGYLYTTHGDGGAGGDPYDNGQNLKSLLGKVHRIDVDRKDPGKNYAIPKDNPFVDRADARPEIWAYGLRNIWRMAFDRKSGRLWAADVGQNLYEEIDLIERGGNYGWNRREGLHPFGPQGTGPRKEFIEPIWEYHHDLGKSIIGGAVYRGTRLPELEGYYVYGDYVSGKIWALRYDEAKSRVVANRPIQDRKVPVFSFGEDEKGEIYFLTATYNGQGIYQFVK